jgi:hypothetical protein
MSLIVPDVAEVDALTKILTPDLTLKLYGNNATPLFNSVAGSFTEIVGGGYASKPLVFANWVIAAGSPSLASYAIQTWNFTGVINAPGTVYGYFVVRNSDGLLMWAERFPVVPFIPIAGSVITVTPTFTGGSVY